MTLLLRLTTPLCWLVLMVSLQGSLPFAAYSADQSPAHVVQHWLTLYPTDMSRAAALLTSQGRNGLSQQEWVEAHARALQRIQLTYLHTKLVYERLVRQDYAQVVIAARVRTIIGEHYHRELYTLRTNSQGAWLIDDVQEYDENYLGFPI